MSYVEEEVYDYDATRRIGLRIPVYRDECPGYGKEHNKREECSKCSERLKQNCYREVYKNFQV
jgi:hypothetical protein